MKVLKSFAAATLIVASPAFAANARCDHCTPETAAALAKGFGVGQHLIFSPTQSIAWAYTVQQGGYAGDESFSDGAVRRLFAQPRSLTPDELDQFNAVLEIYRQTGGTMRWQVTVPIGNLPSEPGIDFSHMSSFQYARSMGVWHRVSQGVVQWSRTPAALGQFGAWWQIAGSAVGVAGTEVEVTVVFPDGGRVTFLVDYGAETMAEQIGPIRDSDNNVIPVPTDSPLVMVGPVGFSNSVAQSRMNDHLSALGWAMRFPSPTANCPFIGRIIYECGWVNGDLRNVSCQRLTQC